MKPNCAVLNPMTQMIRLLAAASTQPSQHLLPTRIVEKTVSTQDKQSSRNMSDSNSNFIASIFPRIVGLVLRSSREDVTLVTQGSAWLNSMLRIMPKL
jgi:hypothetical protein